ncbi:olfactory receptor 52E4-like [Latimeria chalumnae]|uniref:olfactory receptor 52E4-like n=1 Tax=Latimeria chalumnae TaxID=7897 RepID=UPI0006D90508|nr:PREDICTED: olfactory receptor 52E4-like [Latimeria chalumnae]|eukprot:XP_014352382.1 PREDICTED: olfactory receptor 52E4-like [Latimeria chalumnae]
MENDSDISTLMLSGFGEMDNLNYLYFFLTLLTYIAIVSANLLLMIIIVLEESLHEPMYILIGNLAANGLYGSTAFFPKLLANLVTEAPTISRTGCLIQIFFIHTNAGLEIFLLALMAYDRYMSICNPLRYTSVMTNSNLHTFLNNIFGIFVTVLLLGVPLALILISYLLIIKVIQHRYNTRNIPYFIRIYMSVQYIIIPPLLNPIIYGVKTQEIRTRVTKLLKRKISSL